MLRLEPAHLKPLILAPHERGLAIAKRAMISMMQHDMLNYMEYAKQ
jgi:hypothetical protein